MSDAALNPLRRGIEIPGWLAAWVPEPPVWAFAFRVWFAMMLSLAVAFWLQLPSASSAAICVGILAQPRRGQALSKAFYRIGGTVVGFVVSLLLTANFGQDRVLLLVSFGVWLGLCTFVAHYLQGFRAYGAMLSGYTVAIISITNIDAPGDVFESGVERCAAIVVGVVAITLVNSLMAPWTYPDLRRSIGLARSAVQAFARRSVRSRIAAAPAEVGALVRQIDDAGADMVSLAGEFADGPARVAGGRSTVSALFAETAAVRAFARAAAEAEPSEVARLADRIEAGLSGDGQAKSELEREVEDALVAPGATPERVLLLRRAADVLRHEDWAARGEAALAGRGDAGRDVALAVHRDLPEALRNSARTVTAYGIGAACLVLSGLPSASSGLLQLSATAALGAITPDPKAFARGVLIGMPIAVVLAGIARFGLLVLGQDFAMLALVMAPVVMLGCILSLRPATGSIGFILIVFFPAILSPANPQSFDPQSFLDTGVQFILAAILLSLSLRLILQTPVGRRRLWALEATRADILSALRQTPADAEGRINRDSNRLAQFVARRRRRADGTVDRAGLRYALALAEIDTVAASAQARLDTLSAAQTLAHVVDEARQALRRLDAEALHRAAVGLIDRAASVPRPLLEGLTHAVADLATMARLVPDERRVLRRFGLIGQPS